MERLDIYGHRFLKIAINPALTKSIIPGEDILNDKRFEYHKASLKYWKSEGFEDKILLNTCDENIDNVIDLTYDIDEGTEDFMNKLKSISQVPDAIKAIESVTDQENIITKKDDFKRQNYKRYLLAEQASMGLCYYIAKEMDNRQMSVRYTNIEPLLEARIANIRGVIYRNNIENFQNKTPYELLQTVFELRQDLKPLININLDGIENNLEVTQLDKLKW